MLLTFAAECGILVNMNTKTYKMKSIRLFPKLLLLMSTIMLLAMLVGEWNNICCFGCVRNILFAAVAMSATLLIGPTLSSGSEIISISDSSVSVTRFMETWKELSFDEYNISVRLGTKSPLRRLLLPGNFDIVGELKSAPGVFETIPAALLSAAELEELTTAIAKRKAR